MTTINIRIDENIKERAAKTLSKVGLDMSSAIKLFLYQVVNEKGLPFKPRRNPVDIRARWDEQVGEAIKKGKRYSSTEELFSDL